MEKKQINPKYLLKPGTRIKYPFQSGYCKHCARSGKDDYCSSSDNACDKILWCMAFFYKRK